ncbi:MULTISPECIES: AAA family ATPase [Pseudomonas]|uniref:ParA family protein n=2 Tax=Pseudomonas TaxID=286 RepID=A0A2X2CH53_PSELU|nr:MULTISPECIES: AAA family ATPase [Pseudomonas]SER23089.1 chromosome partitioning protein [Pseudomonas lutea]SPZ04986.1 ParA family protein [Pseudomonas luteola]
MIVQVAHVKGGIGKSTLALNLAVSRARQGRKVWLIDADRRPSSIKALTLRNDSGVEPGIIVGHYPDGKELRTQVKLQRDMFDDIVIDSGGQDSSSIRAALLLADVLLIPNSVAAVETWALEEMHALLEEALSVRDEELRVHCILNNAKPGFSNARNLSAQRVVQHFPLFPQDDLVIVKRDAFADAFGLGLCVDELEKPDPKASAELKALMNLIYGDEDGQTAA